MEFHFRYDLPELDRILDCLQVSNTTRCYIRTLPAGMLIQVEHTGADARRTVVALSPGCFTSFDGAPTTIGFFLNPFLEELYTFLLREEPGRAVRIQDNARLYHPEQVNILPVHRLHVSHGRYVQVTGRIFRQLFLMGRPLVSRWDLNIDDPIEIFFTISSTHLALRAFDIVSQFSLEHFHYWMSGDVGNRLILLEFILTPRQIFAAFTRFSRFVVIHFDGYGEPPVLQSLFGDLISVCFTGHQQDMRHDSL